MKKAFDQTVRDLKREVNKKVLKVPGIEQKVLDATSNEPWGPHGSHLADIAQATRNYHEYQMIMAVLWKRINDTGRNWRHVYKALTVLEYLVAHGSERVIDEIKEHAYQISTLSDFQYIDSSGRDQGSNVRKKSQSLVVLVNDKERIQEARQKALVNRDKFRSPTSAGGMDRPGYGDRYDDDRYRRDAGRNGYGDQYDDDRSSRGGDSYSRDGDRYGRDSDDRYARDGYRDDDYRGRSQSNDDYQSGARSRSSDRYRERAFDDDRYSSRSSDAKAEDHSQNQRRLERKFSEQNIGAPPSYEEAVTDVRSPVHDERDAEIPVATAPKASTLTGSVSHSPQTTSGGTTSVPADEGSNGFDEFDPRGAVPAAPPPSTGEMELLGSLVDSNALAIVPTTSTTTSESGFAAESVSGSTFVALSSASTVLNQTIEDPFGDGPFKAIPSAHSSNQQNFSSTNNIQPATVSQTTEPVQPAPVQMQTTSGFDFGDTFEGLTYAPSTSTQFVPSESPAPNQNFDVLADILPPSGPSAQAGPFLALPAPTESPHSHTSVPGHFPSQSGYGAPVTSQGAFYAQNPPPQPSIPGNFAVQSGYGASVNSQGGYNAQNPNSQAYTGNFSGQPGYGASVSSQVAFSAPSGQPLHQSGPGNFQAQSGYGVPQVASQAAFSAPSALAPQQNLGTSYSQTRTATPLTSHTSLPGQTTQLSKPQPTKDKFETKSTVWADTLSRGLVNLNISGAKTNPLADIGVDFEAINRREKREKPVPQQAPISTINMGKAMGSGSGIGRAGAGALAPPNSMMGGGMGMGGGGGMGMRGGGMGMGGYGSGMNQQPGGIGMGMGMGMNNMGMGMGMNNMGMGMGMNNMGMGMGMGGGGGMGMGMNNMGMQMGMNNMGMNQGAQMRPPQGPNMPGYNPMMGSGGYQPQNPYGGYR